MNTSEVLSSLPSEFLTLKDPPDKIFYRGDKSLLAHTKVTIVGSRKSYPYSRSVINMLAAELSRRDICIVSGGAMGIDAIAQEGAYPKTIAVLANGLDIIYPMVNKKLLEKMAKNALLLSEYADGTEARPYSFVQRNRLVVALGDVLVLAQADLNSGSMRSVEFALETGKKIYVLPHCLGESEGSMKLLHEGKAELITDIQEFADRFGKVNDISDDFLLFCANSPSYEEALAFDAQKLFAYELEGKIKVIQGKVIPR
jgi:DNA processing protein